MLNYLLHRGIHRLFHISYFYVPLLGFLTCITIGLIVSGLTGWSTDTDPTLLNPFIQKYYIKKDDEKEKHELEGVVNGGETNILNS